VPFPCRRHTIRAVGDARVLSGNVVSSPSLWRAVVSSSKAVFSSLVFSVLVGGSGDSVGEVVACSG
jgi:hypothetical protein